MLNPRVLAILLVLFFACALIQYFLSKKNLLFGLILPAIAVAVGIVLDYILFWVAAILLMELLAVFWSTRKKRRS